MITLDSMREPRSSSASNVATWPATTETESRRAVRPSAEMTTSYRPAGRLRSTYTPCEVAIAARAGTATDTCALGTAEWDSAALTLPLTSPPRACAARGCTRTQVARTQQTVGCS